MTASTAPAAAPAAGAATAAPQPSFIAPSGQPASAPLTRVALAYIEARFKLYLRFGPLDAAQRIPGVQPGARLLLHAEGDGQVRAVLERIDAIEALGIAPVAVSPAYWRTLANRLAARLPLPEYTAERHAAWLAGRVLP
ncbi:MAG: DUF2840 domain-containing protein [Pseudomonas aeruginosa]|nr:DUF2840 domain-containing protein [Pseudomonas aeruginosa]